MTDEVVSIGVDFGGNEDRSGRSEAAPPRDHRWADGPGFEVLHRERVATRRERGYEAIVETTGDLIAEVAKSAGLDLATTPVGVGMPGAVTLRTGFVKNSNTVCLNGRPFPADLSDRVGRRIVFENDANCFALAEAQLGAGVLT